MTDRIALLIANLPFFKGLTPEELADIRRIAAEQRYERHQMIFTDGEPGQGFFLLIEGQVKVFKVSPDGKEQILHILEPGEPLGQVAVFAGESYPASAEALSASRALFFPRKDFVALINARPSLALNMLAVMSNRLREFTIQIENLSLKEVPARLASYLLYLSEEKGGRDTLTLTISKAQLASIIGTIPETLSRILGRMAAKDLIVVEGRTIRLLNRENLQILAEHGRLVDL
jgi:CRP-like cAMP-binding protein